MAKAGAPLAVGQVQGVGPILRSTWRRRSQFAAGVFQAGPNPPAAKIDRRRYPLGSTLTGDLFQPFGGSAELLRLHAPEE